jgi:endonuclease G
MTHLSGGRPTGKLLQQSSMSTDSLRTRKPHAALRIFVTAFSMLLWLPSQAEVRQEVLAQPTRFAQCPQFFAEGQPPRRVGLPQSDTQIPAGKLRELCYEAFAVLHSGESRTPVFVAQRLNRQILAEADQKRADRFFADARLPRSERAELEDYKGSGYSRGHMAPAADMPTRTAMAQSFSLANMVPQDAQHNGGAWARIEQDTRKYVRRAQGNVYVITGPVFAPGSELVGLSGVQVPSHLYKLVYDETTGKAWAHWQANRAGERVSRPITYRELVKRTGVEFLKGSAERG